MKKRYRIEIVVTAEETFDGHAPHMALDYETNGVADFIQAGDYMFNVDSASWVEIDANGRALGGL